MNQRRREPNDEHDEAARSSDDSSGDALDSDVLADLVADYVDRFQLGESLEPAEILRRHGPAGPQIVEALRTFFDLDTSGGPDNFIQKLGGMQLSRVIGRGGMGIIYEGWEDALDRRVAVKVLPAGAVSDGRALRRFLREARTAARLRHANVVTVYGVGLASGVPYFSMEYVQGETLAALWARLGLVPRNEESPEVHRGALSEVIERFSASSDELAPSEDISLAGLETRYAHACARVFAGAARGLQHAHEQGVVHRDIKPSNLILDEAGTLRILDFGLARIEGDASLTLTGSLVGTPLYMSPEQIRAGWSNEAGRELDRRTDIYSLGVTLYQALARRHPYEGASPRQVMRETLDRDLPDLPSHVPAALRAVVSRCARREPAQRYATAEAVAQDLDRFCRGEPVEARPPSRWKRRVGKAWSLRYHVASALLAIALVAVIAIAVRQGLGERVGMMETTLWEAEQIDTGLDVSANGTKVAYIDWSSYGSVHVRDLESGETLDATASERPRHWSEYASHVLISPDASSVVFTWEDASRPADIRGTLFRVDLDAPGIRHEIPIEADGYHAALDWATDADLVLVSARSSDVPIWLLVSPHDGRVALETPRHPGTVRISPDARHLALERRASPTEPHRDIRILDLWTGVETDVLVGPNDDTLIDFGPAGRHLAFASDRLGSRGLWALPLDDGRPAGAPFRVQRGFENTSAGIANDGTLFSVESWHQEQVWVGELSTEGRLAQALPVLRRAAGSSTTASWSPSGDRLAFRSNDAPVAWHAEGAWRLFIWDADTRGEREVHPRPAFAPHSRVFGPAWIDDHRLVIFATLEGRGAGFWAVHVQNGATRALIPWEGAAGPARFQIAGGALWYTDRREDGFRLLRHDLASGLREEIEDWPPDAGRPILSPDARRFAYIRQRRSGDEPVGSLLVGDLDPFRGPRVIAWPWLEEHQVDVDLSWTPDLRGVIAHTMGSESEVRWIDLETGKETSWEGFPGHISQSLRFHPLGRDVTFSTSTPGFRLVSLSGWLTD